PRGEAISLSSLGLGYAVAGDLDKSAEFHAQALEIFRAAGDRMAIAGSLDSIAHVESRRNRLTEARAAVEEAIEITEAQRLRISSQDLRTSYFASIRGAFELDIDLLMRMDREQPDAGFRAAA